MNKRVTITLEIQKWICLSLRLNTEKDSTLTDVLETVDRCRTEK